MNTLHSLRQAVHALQSLDDQTWDNFADRLHTKTFMKGAFLTQAGQVEHCVYFLNHGATRNFFIRDGKEFTVDFHFAGEFVTAFYSLITREPSGVTIALLENTEVVIIPYTHLQTFYKQHHDGERIGRLIAEYQYVRRLRKEMDLLSLSAEERYAQLMQRNPTLIQTLSVKHVSSYLGIQPESLSRIRKAYARN